MPIGPPSQTPAPKSALRPVVAPMLRTYAALPPGTGSFVTSACQTLVGGRFGQPRSAVPAGGGAGLALPLADADGPGLVDAGPVGGPPPAAASTNRDDGGRPGAQAGTASTTVARTIQRRHSMRIAVA